MIRQKQLCPVCDKSLVEWEGALRVDVGNLETLINTINPKPVYPHEHNVPRHEDTKRTYRETVRGVTKFEISNNLSIFDGFRQIFVVGILAGIKSAQRLNDDVC